MTPYICVSVAGSEPHVEELLQEDTEASLPSRAEEPPALITLEEIRITANEVRPRLHLSRQESSPIFQSDMVLATANGQVKKQT